MTTLIELLLVSLLSWLSLSGLRAISSIFLLGSLPSLLRCHHQVRFDNFAVLLVAQQGCEDSLLVLRFPLPALSFLFWQPLGLIELPLFFLSLLNAVKRWQAFLVQIALDLGRTRKVQKGGFLLKRDVLVYGA